MKTNEKKLVQMNDKTEKFKRKRPTYQYSYYNGFIIQNTLDFRNGSADKESACNTGDTGDMGSEIYTLFMLFLILGFFAAKAKNF